MEKASAKVTRVKVAERLYKFPGTVSLCWEASATFWVTLSHRGQREKDVETH